ncbi:hypothetical protein BOTNAR_0384g00010 [Botryotinia narcissicola]|uniref:Uncharacterized protein n=1 Tax=Botryotinia narcissicola TaxID=278944 RepID=A0A4Z1I1J4_9HELO|nr:hypothetical protein BOTNAR_0384g00010 [Botryotinia narcissicola]
MSSLLTTLFRRSHSNYHPNSSSTSISTPSRMGSCLFLSSGPSPKNITFTSTAFGRSAYVQIEKQDEVKRSLLVNEEDYYSDEEDVGFMDVPPRKYKLNRGTVQMQEHEKMGRNDSSQDDFLLNKTLPPSPEEGDEPPFEGMIKVWSSEGDGRWMWPRGMGVPVVVSDDYRKWREQRDERIGGLRS